MYASATVGCHCHCPNPGTRAKNDVTSFIMQRADEFIGRIPVGTVAHTFIIIIFKNH
jgi:hypothetical protein